MVKQDNKFEWEKNYDAEFATVNSFLNSDAVTAKTDAFILVWVKTEKQVRKIFTHLIYQLFTDKEDIKETIVEDKHLYFEHFIRLFDALYKTSFADIVGDEYKNFLDNDLNGGERKRIKKFRNKILHGQLTNQGLGTNTLSNEIDLMRNWVKIVAEKMSEEIGYDGLGRNSLTESQKKDIKSEFKEGIDIKTQAELEDFINDNKK
jgi:hypothetical protein